MDPHLTNSDPLPHDHEDGTNTRGDHIPVVHRKRHGNHCQIQYFSEKSSVHTMQCYDYITTQHKEVHTFIHT